MTQIPEADAYPETVTVQEPAGWQFILDYPRPPKSLSANDRRSRFVRQGATKDIRMEVFAKTRALHLGVLDAITVQVTWVVADRRRRDVDNLWPFCKVIYDGIGADKGISAHLVEDDDPSHMQKPTPIIRYEKGARPHFQVTITPWGGPDEVTF